MKSAKNNRTGNSARARNVRGKRRTKGKKGQGEKESSFDRNTTADFMEDTEDKSSLGKLHAKIQRQVDDKDQSPKIGAKMEDVNKKQEVQAKEDEAPEIAKKEMNPEIQKKEAEDPQVQKKEEEINEKRDDQKDAVVPRYNQQFFEVVSSGKGDKLLYVKDGVSAYDAVQDIFNNPGEYSLDNSELVYVAVLAAKAKKTGREKFDQVALENTICIRLAATRK